MACVFISCEFSFKKDEYVEDTKNRELLSGC